MKKIVAILILFGALSASSFAQALPTVTTDEGSVMLTGTYQFIYKDRISDEAITLNDVQLAQLEALRDDLKTLYISFSEATLIKLPSKQEISSPSFVPLTSKIYVIEETNYADYQNLPTIPFQ